METSSGSRLEKLQAKKRTLEAQIRQAQGRERQQRHRLDTRRKVLAGAAILAEAERRGDYRQELMGLLGRFLTRPDERALFDLPPLGATGPELVVVQPESKEPAATETASRVA